MQREGESKSYNLNGLMSKTGVPSNMSRPLTFNTFFSLFKRVSTERPMGFGLTGEQVLNTPVKSFQVGGF